MSKFPKELNLTDYKKIVFTLKKNKSTNIIKLLGGEPTLHTNLFEMIEFALENGFDIQIFTNGIFDKRRAEKLQTYGNRIYYTLNVMTPGFKHNIQLRKLVSQNIISLGKSGYTALSVTLDPFFMPAKFFSTLDVEILKTIKNIRIGLGNPIIGQKNWYAFEQFHQIGPVMIDFMQLARTHNFTGTFDINCGLTRCMFTDSEFETLKRFIPSIGWGCFGKKSTMDIATNLDAFHCFPLSDYKRINIRQTGYTAAYKKLIHMRMNLWNKLKMNMCMKCPFHGYGEEKCPGPCLAFRMNGIKK